MKVYLNERSVIQLRSEEEAFSTLERIVQMVPSAYAISNNQHIQRHRELKDKEILQNVSLGEFIRKLLADKDGEKRTMGLRFLALFSKGPFLQSAHPEPATVRELNGNCLRDTCFDCASSQRTGAAMISFSPPINRPHFSVQSSIYGKRTLLNIEHPAQIGALVWVYKESPKHNIPEDRRVNGKVHSALLLDEATTKDLLINGVMYGRSVYNKLGEQWYKFNCEGNNMFHCFPISLTPQTKELSAAIRFIGTDNGNRDGQAFGDGYFQ